MMIKTLFPFKSILAILIFLSFQQILFSQSAFTIGVKGGMISNKYIISAESASNLSTDSRIGISAGITSQLFKSKHFMLNPEIFYLQRGMGYSEYNYDGVLLEGKTTVSCLSFAILPSYRFENKILSPYIFAGPRLEFVLNHDENDMRFLYNFLNTTNFGFSAGLGLEKEITKKINITADIRYSRDFTNFESASLNVSGEFYKYINSSFDFLLGVNYVLGRAKK